MNPLVEIYKTHKSHVLVMWFCNLSFLLLHIGFIASPSINLHFMYLSAATFTQSPSPSSDVMISGPYTSVRIFSTLLSQHLEPLQWQCATLHLFSLYSREQRIGLAAQPYSWSQALYNQLHHHSLSLDVQPLGAQIQHFHRLHHDPHV
ncbi:PREDICTED: uncharacterized protein LOC109131029 [Camelina sativa]|uniref:Uncharacterized protein LOC109131029 n=1 Tax=Camelina sativa TaxID=90675 RepID=A0ABM1RD38_CAMSA|nr:PREDICTED: uncharacterized protein LOC109131029 [Camelina sativa]